MLRLTAVAVLCLTSATAWPYGLGEPKDPLLGRIAERAAAYLVRARLPAGGWTWERNDGRVADNYGGIVAESLLAVHEQSGRSVYLEAARDYADGLLRKYERAPGALPFKPDLELLVRLSEVTGETGYALVAARWFAAVERVSPRPADEVGRIRRGRHKSPDLVGYDVALGIRAALAVERVDYARGLADTVLATRADWLVTPDGTFGTISRAALVDALLALDGRAYAGVVRELVRALVAEQVGNGSWCKNETQATAYAVRALARVSEPRARGAAKRGAAWLSRTLLDDGAWAHFNDGLPPPFVGDHISEIQAEALTAVILASKL